MEKMKLTQETHKQNDDRRTGTQNGKENGAKKKGRDNKNDRKETSIKNNIKVYRHHIVQHEQNRLHFVY